MRAVAPAAVELPPDITPEAFMARYVLIQEKVEILRQERLAAAAVAAGEPVKEYIARQDEFTAHIDWYFANNDGFQQEQKAFLDNANRRLCDNVVALIRSERALGESKNEFVYHANDKFSRGYAATGVAMGICAWHEFVLPTAVADLQKGERYANIDWVFMSLLQHLIGLLWIIVSYDIACQWSRNLKERLAAMPPLPRPLRRRLDAARNELAKQEDKLREFSLNQADDVEQWKAEVDAFKADPSQPNPYTVEVVGMTEREVRDRFEKEEAAAEATGRSLRKAAEGAWKDWWSSSATFGMRNVDRRWQGFRNQLHVKARFLIYKKVHSRHQGANTRSRALVARNENRILLHADKYQAARRALVTLSGNSAEGLVWPALLKDDIRCMDGDGGAFEPQEARDDCKAYARTRRWKEEEWRRLPLSFGHEERQWVKRAESVDVGGIDAALAEGLIAYASKQVEVYRGLARWAERVRAAPALRRGQARPREVEDEDPLVLPSPEAERAEGDADGNGSGDGAEVHPDEAMEVFFDELGNASDDEDSGGDGREMDKDYILDGDAFD
ncbi:hypothetical protein MKEN_01072100 [Mycena kentingensis (nom. inval.)]|nr:hypothetical protein MKEN_01072100 [Mycena kentingensis (nom. inval.)]